MFLLCQSGSCSIMSVWNHVPIPWEKFSCLLNAGRTVIWTFLWTKNSTELGKAVFNFLSPYLCYSYKYDHARCGRGDMLHLKHFIILTLCYANLRNCQKFTSGEQFLWECVLLWPVCCQPYADLIIINGMSCRPNICDFSDWLLCASYTLSFVIDRQTDMQGRPPGVLIWVRSLIPDPSTPPFPASFHFCWLWES